MQYRITYQAHDAEFAETIIVGGIRAVYALIEYANSHGDIIAQIDQRASRTRTWQPSNITQQD